MARVRLDFKIVVDRADVLVVCPGGRLRYRYGTGGNVEITHLKVETPREGLGTAMLKGMLQFLKSDPPYCTVYGFSLPHNTDAHAFYRAMGFTLTRVAGVYMDGSAVVFSANYKDLCRIHLGEEVQNGRERSGG